MFYFFSNSDHLFKLFVCCLNDLLTICLSLILLYCLKTPLPFQCYIFHISYITLLHVSCLIGQGFSCVLGRPISSRCRFCWRLYYALTVSFRTLTVKDDSHVFPFSEVDDQELQEHSSNSVQQNSNAPEIVTELVHTRHKQTLDQSTTTLLRHLDNIYCN